MKTALVYMYIPFESDIPYDNIIGYSLSTFQLYCNKYGIDLIEISHPMYGLNDSNYYNMLMYEKNQIYELFKLYDRIFRIDIDMMIRHDCPNIFDIVPRDKIGAVYEDVGSRTDNRRERILAIQHFFGESPEQWTEGYFNAGMVVASKEHADVFRNDIDFLNNTVASENPKMFKVPGTKFEDFLLTEQTILNWQVKNKNVPFFPMSFKFNHLKFFSERWNGKADRMKSHIIHYAGHTDKASEMERDFHKIIREWATGESYA